jgi:hypothetical protein
VAIVVSRNHRDARRHETTPFEGDKLEAFMQDYLLANPEAIPLEEVTGRKWCIVAKELEVSYGFIDFLGMDQDGGVYAIETKRKANQDSREVIAQLLDYAASLWGDYGADAAAFWSDVEQNARQNDIDLKRRLRGMLGAADNQYPSNETQEEDATLADLDDLRLKVGEHLRAGDFKLVAVMDELKPNVKAMVRYLNEHGDFGVLGVELAYYELEEENLQVVVPTVYGDEAWGKRDQATSTQTGVRWSEAEFLASLGSLGDSKLRDTVIDLLEFTKRNTSQNIFQGRAKRPRFSLRVKRDDGAGDVAIYSVICEGSTVRISLNALNVVARWKAWAVRTELIPPDYKRAAKEVELGDVLKRVGLEEFKKAIEEICVGSTGQQQ